jgi:hypothetical protein
MRWVRTGQTGALVVLALALGPLTTTAAAVTQVTAVTPGAEITASPNSGLVNGEAVKVTGSGLSAQQQGAIVECNDAPGQPTITFDGFAVPVSCSDILGGGPFVFVSPLVSTSTTGTFTTTFVVRTGVLGPPVSGTDSSGVAGTTDTAGYPCPPTPAQRAAGDRCFLAFGDLAGDLARTDISFAPPASRYPVASVPQLFPPVLAPEASGTSVEVLATGLSPDSPSLVAECNVTPKEPPGNFPGFPVGCAQPVITEAAPYFPVTDGTGSLAVSVRLLEGNLGASRLSAAYPCPPSAANLSTGGSCDVVVEDAGGDTAEAPLSLVGPAPVPTIAASPSSGLLNGQEVKLSGSGFPLYSVGDVFECNETPGEPTVVFDDSPVPVGCSSPYDDGGWTIDPGFGSTDQNGDLQGSITVRTGALGPPTTGTDSTGGDAASDSLRYPCPPTPAEVSLGASCGLMFLDDAGEVATTPIDFGTPQTFTPSLEVQADLGTIDQRAIPAGTSVVVVGSGFTPRSLFVVLECPVTPGGPTDPVSQLFTSCQPLVQSGPLVTDEAGEVTTVVQVRSLPDYSAPAPDNSPCTAGISGVVGTCEIVVRDGAGEVALVPIGVAPGANPPAPLPVFPVIPTTTTTIP